MTLIVARQVNNEIYIVGDTKFSDQGDRGWSESKKYIGGLKIVLLTPGLCVGFAGDEGNARKAIQGVYDQGVNLFDKNQAIEYFLNYHIRSVEEGPDLTTNFIVAVIIEDDLRPGTFLKEVFRIADSKVYWENQTAHIGCSKAFSHFHEVFHNGGSHSNVPTFEIAKLGEKERPGFDQSLSSAMRAMRGVIDNPSILSVDGVCTVVISEEDQFKYAEYVQVRGNPIPVSNEPGAPVSFGDAAEGSAHWHVGMFSQVGHGILPVYSYTGRFGLIYHPEKCFEPRSYPNCTLEEFRLKVEERMSVAHQRALNYQANFS